MHALEQPQRLLQVLAVAFKGIDLRAFILQNIEQMANLNLQRGGDLPELLDVVFVREVDHEGEEITSAIAVQAL